MKTIQQIILKTEPLKALITFVYIFWLGGISLGLTLFMISELSQWWHYVLYALYHLPLLWIKSINDFATKCI